MLHLSTPQQDLRTPKPGRPALRIAASAEYHAAISGHLTIRDRWIARMLAEHRTLTSTQIIEIAFPSRRMANLRLAKLAAWRIVDRFQPYIGKGRSPMFYVMDITGAHALAAEDGIDPATLHFKPERSIGIAHSLRLAHLHGLNGFFTALLGHARSHDDLALSAWWPETRCAQYYGDIVRPDGYGRWRDGNREIEWFLEWDTGSYPLTRFTTKLPGYTQLATTTGIITPLLICFGSASREAHARRQLADHLRDLPRPGDLPIATTSADHLRDTDSAADAIWLPLTENKPAGRLRLIDLPESRPHRPPPTSGESQGSSPRSAGDLGLSPPASMPPWTDVGDLTWNPAR